MILIRDSMIFFDIMFNFECIPLGSSRLGSMIQDRKEINAPFY